jgi:transposase, IS30 family
VVGRKRGARPGRLSDRLRDEIDRRVVAGETQLEVAAAVGCDPRTVIRWITRTGGVRSYERRRSERALSLAEREEIGLALERGESAAAIASRLGRATSTVTRELARNGGRPGYRAARADARALEQARRPKPAKLARSPRLRAEVERRLGRALVAAADRCQAASGLSRRSGDAGVARDDLPVAVRAIARSVATRARQPVAFGPLAPAQPGCPAGRRPARDRPIAERPAEVDDRAVPGHWEGDLILGKAGRSAIATLVERQTRFTMLIRLPAGRSAESVRVALTESIQRLPEALRRTLTWDQGKEMAEHARFSVDSKVEVYFCDPSSPWQRGTSENTNGLLRQYLPKGDDLARYRQAELDSIADQLNGRPRQTLKWLKPSEAFDQLIATTA